VLQVEYAQWFARRLSSLRMEKGVSARDMSLSLGQSASYINKIENQRTMPSMAGFFYICDYLGITPMEFFDWETQSPSLASEIKKEAKKLPPEKAAHVLQLLRDITGTDSLK